MEAYVEIDDYDRLIKRFSHDWLILIRVWLRKFPNSLQKLTLITVGGDVECYFLGAFRAPTNKCIALFVEITPAVHIITLEMDTNKRPGFGFFFVTIVLCHAEKVLRSSYSNTVKLSFPKRTNRIVLRCFDSVRNVIDS